MAQPSTAQSAVAAQHHHGPSLVRGLSLTDSVMLLAGGIIGSGIFLTAGPIASAVRTPLFFLGVWLAGGLISLLACFAFAEMGAMFPEAGGQYVYLREAYGEFPAFLYGWMIFTVGQSGTIAALAVGFAEYFGAVLPVGVGSCSRRNDFRMDADARAPCFHLLHCSADRDQRARTEARLGADQRGDLGEIRGHRALHRARTGRLATAIGRTMPSAFRPASRCRWAP